MYRQREELDGYVVDIQCLRGWPQNEILDRARDHARECSLKGCSIESGYALIQDNGTPVVLDPEATPMVVDTISMARIENGIRLRIEREMEDDGMRSVLVAEA